MNEIFTEFKQQTTKTTRQDILRKYYKELKPIFDIIFSNIQFHTVPNILPDDYKETDNLSGLTYSTIHHELKRLYLFQTSNTLTNEKRHDLLLQILESLTKDEAILFLNILNKKLNVPYLTPKLINETYNTQYEIR